MKIVNKIVNFSIAFAICLMIYIIVIIMLCIVAFSDWERAKKEFLDFNFIGDMKDLLPPS